MNPRLQLDDEDLDDEDIQARHEALQLGEAVLVDLLRELYGQVAMREASVKSEWEDSRALLEQKKWTMEQQLEILEKEVADLHAKLARVEARFKERAAVVRSEYRKVLHSFYLINNPGHLKVLDQVLNYYAEHEFEMIDKIKERYGIELDVVPLHQAGVLPEDKHGRDEVLSALAEARDEVWAQVAQVEELVTRSNEEFERVKRELYFPRAEGWRFKQGFDGVYVAMNDFWLEALSVRLSISIMDRAEVPGIFVFAGASRAPGSEHVRKIIGRYSDQEGGAAAAQHTRGGVVSFRLDKCGLYGEKGTKIPTLRPDQLRLLVEFTLTVPVKFSPQNTWMATSEFQFKILRIERKIKGSIYLPRSLLRMVLNRVLPSIIKTAIVGAIPVELGHYLRTQYETLGKSAGVTSLGARRERPPAKEPPMHLDLDVNVIGEGGDLTALDANMSLVPESSQGAAATRSSPAHGAPGGTSNRWASTGGPAPAHHVQAAKRTREILGLSAAEAATFVALQYEIDKVFRSRAAQSPNAGPVGGTPRHRSPLPANQRKAVPRGSGGGAGTGTKRAAPGAELWPGPLVTATDLVQFFMRFSEASFPAHEWRRQRARVARGEDAGTPPKETWETILSTMQQLADKYATFFDTARVNVFQLFERVRRLTLKPMRTHIELSNVRLRGSVDAVVFMIRKIMERQTKELYAESLKRRVHLTKSLERCQQDIKEWFREAMEPIAFIKQSLHAVSLSVQGRGAGGEFVFSGDEVSFQGPAKFIVPFDPTLYPPTHFAIRTSINEDHGAFSMALSLAPFLDPEETFPGSVLELSLIRASAGVFFDVNAYLAARMLEFKSMELASSTPPKEKPFPGAKGEDAAVGAGPSEDAAAVEEEPSDGAVLSPKHTVNRRISDASTSTIFDSNESDEEDLDLEDNEHVENAAKSSRSGRRSAAHRRSSAAATDATWADLDRNMTDGADKEATDEEDEGSLVDDDFDPKALERDAFKHFEEALSGGHATLDDHLIGSAEDDKANGAATERAYAQSSLAEGSMDRFLQHFTDQLASRGEVQDKAGVELLQTRFAHEGGSRFAFRVDTHELSMMKAAADHVEVAGSVESVVAYIRGWLRYLREQAAKGNKAQSDPSSSGSESKGAEEYPGLARAADLLVKYLDSPEVKFLFTFQVQGGTRKGHLVGSLLQSAVAGRQLADGASASVIETPLNLLEVCADVINMIRGMYESENDKEELGYFW